MPARGSIDELYPSKLENINIRLMETFKSAKQHHALQCMICSHIWSATPVSKIQAHKKFGHNGCPNCNDVRIADRMTMIRHRNIQKLKDRDIEVLSDWDGTTGAGQNSTPVQVVVKNTKCGHTFTTSSKNLLTRGVTCPVCAREYKNAVLTANSKSRSEEWQKTASDWKLYKSTVTKLTRLSYNKHKDQINPTNLPTGRAGTPGAYHLDHIVPIRYCYDNNIPEDVCAHHTNLQMLGWRENVGSRDNLKEGYQVPAILLSYINQ